MEVVLVVPVIAAEDEHGVLEDHGRVAVPGRGRLLSLVAEDLLPRVVVDVVLIEVIDSVEAVIAAEDEDASRVDDGDVSVPGRGRHVVSLDLLPSPLIDVVAEEVVLALHAIIPAEDVNIVLEPYA